MGQLIAFPAPFIDVQRLDDTADRLEQVQWDERELRIRRANDVPARITNADIWDRFIDGTIPAIGAAAFLIGVVIGAVERMM